MTMTTIATTTAVIQAPSTRQGWRALTAAMGPVESFMLASAPASSPTCTNDVLLARLLTLGPEGPFDIGPGTRLALPPQGEAKPLRRWHAGRDHAVVVSEHNRGGTVAYAELAEDTADVRLDGRLSDVQSSRDLCVGCTPGHQPEDVVLTVGQQIEACSVASGRSDHPAITVEHTRRNRLVEPGSASGDRPNCRDQLFRRAVLEHGAGGAGLDRSPQHFVLAECGEHEHVERVVESTQLRRCGNTVERRHPDVHQDDVRAQGRKVLHGLAAIGTFGDDIEAVFGREDSGQAGSDDSLVVNKSGPNHRLPRSSTGSSQLTRQPSRVGPAANSPPSAVARSCIPISP